MAKFFLVLYYISTGGTVESDILDHGLTLQECLENAETITPLAIQNREVFAVNCESEDARANASESME